MTAAQEKRSSARAALSDKLTEKNNELLARIVDLERDLAASTQDVANERANAERSIVALSQRVNASETEVVRLREELSTVTAEAAASSADAKELMRRNADLEARVASVEAARQSDLPEVERLKQAKEDAEAMLQRRSQEFMSTRRVLEGRIASLQRETAALTEHCSRLESAAADDHAHATLMRASLDASTKELATLRAELVAADARRDSAVRAAQDEVWHLQQLLNEEVQRNEGISALQLELDQSNSKADRLSALLRDVQGNSAAVTTLKWKVVCSQNREARQSALAAKLRRKIAVLEQRAAESERELARLRSAASRPLSRADREVKVGDE